MIRIITLPGRSTLLTDRGKYSTLAYALEVAHRHQETAGHRPVIITDEAMSCFKTLPLRAYLDKVGAKYLF